MNLLFACFSFRGRGNRARYWLISLILAVVTFACSAVSNAVATTLPALSLIALLLLAPTFIAALANGARRLHDRGKSAWWLIVFAGIPTLLITVAESAAAVSGEGGGALVALVSLPFTIWAFVELGCLKGVGGPNRFGEDPLGAPAQPAVA